VQATQTKPRLNLSLALPVAPEAPAQPGLGVDDRDDDAIKAQVFPVAYEQWLAGGWRSHGKSISEQTRRSYRRAVSEFKTFIGDRYPIWRVMGSQVIAWQNEMRGSGLSETTINLRLSGLSSLFDFMVHKFNFPDPRTGREMYLASRNPVESATRTKINPYGKAPGLAQDEVLAMLRRINRSTVTGLRDYALVITYLSTGRRSNEIGALKWGDLEKKGDIVFYRWSGKGKEGHDELHQHAYEAICAYLQAAGRLETIQDDDYIFVALSDVAQRLPNVTSLDHNKPLSGAMINRIVKKCAKRAGLDESRIHTHTLRHTAADLRYALSGKDLADLQHFLRHSNLSTTQIYMTERNVERDPLWKSVGAFFQMV
jgi:site-specific recombinase XerD